MPYSMRISLTRINPGKTQSRTQGSHEYHSVYQSGYCSVCILSYLFYKIQINQELNVHTNTTANINPDTAQSVFSGICLKRYN